MSDIRTSSGDSVDLRVPAGPDLSFAKVPLDRIAQPAGLFDERVPIDPATLALFLPIIVKSSSGSYQIVDGWKRFKVLCSQGQKQCACGIIASDLNEKQAGLLRIRLNGARTLDPVEKLLFVRWLTANLERDAYLSIVEQLRLTPAERHDYERLTTCSEMLVDAVLRKVLDPAVAPEMSHLSDGDAQALITLFTKLSFTRQMQRELVEWLHEIAFIGKATLPALLATEPVIAILSSATLNPPQKIAALHDYAFATRFPLYAKAKKAWETHSRHVNPDPGKVGFQASPSFEKNSVDMRIRLSNAEAAHALMQKLALISRDDWEKLIDPTALLSDDSAKNQPGN